MINPMNVNLPFDTASDTGVEKRRSACHPKRPKLGTTKPRFCLRRHGASSTLSPMELKES